MVSQQSPLNRDIHHDTTLELLTNVLHNPKHLKFYAVNKCGEKYSEDIL